MDNRRRGEGEERNRVGGRRRKGLEGRIDSIAMGRRRDGEAKGKPCLVAFFSHVKSQKRWEMVSGGGGGGGGALNQTTLTSKNPRKIKPKI